MRKAVSLAVCLNFVLTAAAVAVETGMKQSTSTAKPALPAGVQPCVRAEFKTTMIRTACAKGGEPAANDAMKAFCKDKRITSCLQCHSTQAPRWDLKSDGLNQFQKLGGS